MHAVAQIATSPASEQLPVSDAGLIRLTTLALDYDGTIAVDGALERGMSAAIQDVRRRGIHVLLVTGRNLRDLRRLLPDLSLFDAIVAENGALVYFPGIGRSVALAAPPPRIFLYELRERGVPVTEGACVVEADASHATAALAVIRELELPLAIAFNRGRLMVLPQAISKATGIREALTALRLSAHNAMAIGDAENDHELLAACEVGVAVGWGSPALKAMADLVLEGSGPSDVANYIRRLARGRYLPAERPGRRRLLLGQQCDGHELSLQVRGRSILIAGEPKSGKSWIAGLLCEQLILQGYSVFVIDPEGDYTALEALPGVLVFGEEKSPPRLTELTRVLHHPDVSIVADLSMLSQTKKREYVKLLLHLLIAHRRRTGLPHRIVLDEAHYFLSDTDVLEMLDLKLAGYVLVTYRASRLHPQILSNSEAILLTHETDRREIQALSKFHGLQTEQVAAAVSGLKLEEAVLLPGVEEACGRLCRFKVAPRLSFHVRHRHKYFDVPVPAERAFIFAHGDGSQSRVRTLKEFVEQLRAIASSEARGYLDRHDLSRWLDDVFGDYRLAEEVKKTETQSEYRPAPIAIEAIVRLIEKRYALGVATAEEPVETSG